jgi:signal transduction histidine kinase
VKPTPPAAGVLSLQEVARLAALWRLCAGAAHVLNNSFTAILGEASFLRDERKGDAAVVEACETILIEVERCARLCRALLARQPAHPRGSEADLARLARGLADLLAESLGRRFELHAETTPEPVAVPASADSLELLVLALAHAAADLAGAGGRLLLRVARPRPGRARLGVRLEAPGLGAESAIELCDPGSARDPQRRTLLLAAREIVASLQGELSGHASAGWLEIEVDLPAL